MSLPRHPRPALSATSLLRILGYAAALRMALWTFKLACLPLSLVQRSVQLLKRLARRVAERSAVPRDLA